MSEKQEIKEGSISVDFSKFLKPDDPENIVLNITSSHFSNYALIQLREREMHIDFLELPGSKRDDKWRINAVRIYLTPDHSRKIANILLDLLDKADKKEKETTADE